MHPRRVGPWRAECETARQQGERAVNREPGWYEDPFFLGRQRYWENGWTDRIRADNEPTPESASFVAPDPPAAAAAATTAATTTPAAMPPGVPPTSGGDVTAVLDGDTSALPALLGQRAEQGDHHSEDPDAAGSTHSANRRLAFAAAACVLVVLVIVAVILATSGPSHGGTGGTGGATAGTASARSVQSTARGHSTSAATLLVTAAEKTLAKKTAAMNLAVTLTDPDQSTPLHVVGTGDFELGSGLGTLSITLVGTSTVDQQFVFQGLPVFIHVTNSPVAGKAWVAASTIDLPGLGPASSLSQLIELLGDPGKLVQQLTGASVVVTPLGSSFVDGQPVQGYSVSFSSNQSTTAAAALGTHTFEEVDIGANKLVKLIVIPTTSDDVDGHSAHEDVAISFSRYGSALNVPTPPSSQVLSLSQYLTVPSTSAAGE